jgi:TPR repeat protein
MDMQETLNQWAIAAQEGDAEAQYNLGMNCVMESGASPDYEAAYDWFLKAATRGHAEAQNFLGWMFSHAQGVPQDDEEAVKWFRLSAGQNNAPAQNNLGWMLQNGRGCEQDDAEAVTWYRKAAEQDCHRGQLHYGLMCRDGRGLHKDVTEAADWLRKSSDKGDAEAAYELGKMYESGEGVEADRRSALLQYMRAARQRHEAARAKVQELKAANPDATQGIILPSGETIEGNFVTFPRVLAERIRISKADDERLQLVDELTHFYAESAPARAAEQNWLELVGSIEGLEKRAEALVRTGGRMEKCKAWKQAILIYREAVRIEPEDRKMWYFAHNNLGFCLNQLCQFEEGEAFCRKALKIDGTRSNAYKNTALALQGQCRFPEAAELFITGTLTRPQDRRSLDHLVELLESHPEIREKLPTIDADIEKCCEAVENAK